MNSKEEGEGQEQSSAPITPDKLPLPFLIGIGFDIRERFLPPELCDRIIGEIRSGHTSPIGTVDIQGNVRLTPEIRRTDLAQVPRATMKEVDGYLEQVIPSLSEHFKLEPPLSQFEPPQFLLYQEGHFFNPHRDISGPPDTPERRRKVSVSIFLNGEETYQGGYLAFSLPLVGQYRWVTTAGQPGLFLAFPSNLIHAVTPLESGERFSIVTWYS